MFWRCAFAGLGVLIAGAIGWFYLAPSSGSVGDSLEGFEAGASKLPATKVAALGGPAAQMLDTYTDPRLVLFASSGAAAHFTDEAGRHHICGVWRYFSDGERTITLKSDGTGVLVYRPESLKRRLALGSVLTVQIRWMVKDGHVDFRSISGEPDYGFKVAAAYEGTRKYRRIAELTDEQMLLINETNEDDAPQRIWKRVNK